MEKNQYTTIVSRIKTQNGSYIGISMGDYGNYMCIWFDKNLACTGLASADQWFWASTWGQELEHGNWNVEVPVKVVPEHTTSTSFKKEFDNANVCFADTNSQEWLGDKWSALWDATSYEEDRKNFFAPEVEHIFYNTVTHEIEHWCNRPDNFKPDEVETTMSYDRTEGTFHIYVSPYGEHRIDFSHNIF